MRHATLLLCSVFFFACSDVTSDIGLGLLEDGTTPIVHEVLPSVFQQTTANDHTGSNIGTNITRVLAGRVDDPVLGTISSTGYLNFTGSFPATNTSSLTGVELHLLRDYVYGDTSVTLDFTLYEITEDWTDTEGRANALVSTGDRITTFSLPPGDTLAIVPLPTDWMDQNVDALRSSNFDSLYYGFSLQAHGGNAVIGFATIRSALVLKTGSDDISYLLTRVLTGITRHTEPTLPETHILLQDGAGPGIRMNFDLAELSNRAINGVQLQVTTDATPLTTHSPNFVRPEIDVLQLAVVESLDEPDILIGEAVRSEEGIYEFGGEEMRRFFQNVLVHQAAYSHLELRAPYSSHSINALFLHTATNTGAPKALFIISP